jgi:protoporphyrinogen IX oxidase
MPALRETHQQRRKTKSAKVVLIATVPFTNHSAGGRMPAMILWIKIIHISAVISWMAGLLYLPRLFVYHSTISSKSEASVTFKVMERRLLKGIMNPAMLVTWITGIYMAHKFAYFHQPWLQIKISIVAIMSAFHGYLASRVQAFTEDRNNKSEFFYRIINEIPTILMIVIIALVVLKPF